MQMLRTLSHFLIALIAICGLYLLLRMLVLKPQVEERTEVARGVFLTVGNENDGQNSRGLYMIAELHTRTPGLVLQQAHFDEEARAEGGHFISRPADWAMFRQPFTLLVNTVMHQPITRFGWWPGQPLRCIESVVINGQLSHDDDNTYMVWWDKAQNLEIELQKPPTPEILQRAYGGIGTQAVVISEGILAPFFAAQMNSWNEMDARMFIGVNPESDILWFIAAERATEAFVTSLAMDAGVQYGGFLDSGDSTTFLLGRDVPGMKPYSGFRGWRPLGSYLTVLAAPLQK